MSGRDLPDAAVSELNKLGFVLIDGDAPYNFVRVSLAGELRLLIRALAFGRWLVRVTTREPIIGYQLHAFLAAPLRPFGTVVDDTSLEVSDEELCEQLPRMLAESLLPSWDSACREG